MKIFITGSKGFIGSELVKHLSGKYKHYKIVGYNLKDGQDILDYKKLKKAMKGCDIVVHLAAIRKPLEDKIFENYFRTNCEGTFNVAEAALENKVKRLIFASSMSYYGIERGIPVEMPITEKSSVLTQRVKAEKLTNKTRLCDVAYSTSKVIAEQILANYGMTKKLEVIILRLGPTRPKGEYRPFGKLKLHLKIENAVDVLEKSITTKKKIWYETFSIVDKIKSVDISKARRILGYKPI